VTKFLPVVTCIAVFASATGGCATASDPVVKRLADEKTPEVLIGATGVVMPLGYFALVKDGDRYCAVKFLETGAERAPVDAVPNHQYAIYEWHYQSGNGTADFSRPAAKHGTGKATWEFTRVFGRLSFQTGNVGVDCGDIHRAWHGGTALSFAEARADESAEETIKHGVKIAPTKGTDIKDVDVLDKRLTWYMYDSKRRNRSVPIDSLY
jgi:hypothetical protein